MDASDYDHQCKYCKAKPFVPGPHHANTCRRYQATVDLRSEEANSYKCKHCGVSPFVAGPHHQTDCPRREGSVFRQRHGLSSSDLALTKDDFRRLEIESARLVERFSKEMDAYRNRSW